MKRTVLFALSLLMIFTASACSAASPRETPVVKVVRENMPSVVNISTERVIYLRQCPFLGVTDEEFNWCMEQLLKPTMALKLKSVGSGVIIDEGGLIVTNAHVVSMASNIIVVLHDGAQLKGEVVYSNAADDIAFIKIKPDKKLKKITFAPSGDIMIGETVVAVGNPYGLQNSVTVGVVSGVDRNFYSKGKLIMSDLIQTDAAINLGNSGGALLNLEGKMVGLGLAVVQESQSIGFAIPVEKIEKDIKKYKSGRYTYSPQGTWQQQPGRAVKTPVPLDNKQATVEGFVSYRDDGDAYVVEISTTGIDTKKLYITAKPDSLTISGESVQEVEEKDEARGVFFSQTKIGQFSRTIPFAETIDPDKAEVDESREGVMVITLPKAGR